MGIREVSLYHVWIYTRFVWRVAIEFTFICCLACDEFYSKLEATELDKKALEKEKQALKKLENVKRDHEKRIKELKNKQDVDMKKGQLIGNLLGFC